MVNFLLCFFSGVHGFGKILKTKKTNPKTLRILVFKILQEGPLQFLFSHSDLNKKVSQKTLTFAQLHSLNTNIVP